MSEEPQEQELPTLALPADGIPDVIDTRDALDAAIAAFAAASGPVAIDAERAQGYRYSHRAYLLQLRRRGAGTILIDPTAFDGLADLGAAIKDAEWIIHAATQDLPNLAEEGMLPTRLFDTELAGRLLGDERVGLGALLEQELGVHLKKEHSAADWSQRPLPEEWLAYAALDVELLIELRDIMHRRLEESGKLGWAEQEFAALVASAGDAPAIHEEPWRRLSTLHVLRSPAQLAAARALYEARDEIARRLDRGPSRIVNDRAIVEAAAAVDAKKDLWPTRVTLRDIEGFRRRQAHRFEENWLAAIAEAKALPSKQWPARHVHHDGPPSSAKSWENKHPEAYERWLPAREAQLAKAEEITMPPENVVSPGVLRQVAWEPPTPCDEAGIHAALMAAGAREWQADQMAPLLADVWA